VNSSAEKDILRFIVDMAEVRDDEDAVKKVIDAKLSTLDPYLHAALLKVTLRVMVAQFYAPPVRRLAEELGYPLTDIALARERRSLDGTPEDDDSSPPDLKVINGDG
jgi:hypothetical protein